jgi:asparagine synthase (glutamine-hydrolysing)
VAALVGTFSFDERPVAKDAMSLGSSLRMLGHADADVESAAALSIGLGSHRVWRCESTRLVRSSSGRVLAFDGRLDNRDDLSLALHGRFADATDAALALDVFDRWSIDGLRRLVGEWSAAIWDAADRTVHLARDYMGTRPLYYALGSGTLMWSSSLAELALRSGRRDALSETFFAVAVARQLTADCTPYHGIRAVPAATCVSISASGGERRRRFWSIASGSIRARCHGDYDSALRGLWSEAVGARLQTTHSTWAELSGGLDSSSVVCMADALIRQQRVPAAGLRLISHATLESCEGDERPFIAEIERRVAVSSHVLGLEQHRELVDDEWDWVSPFAARGVGLACVRHVRRHGGQVVLSGRMGDAVMGGEPDNSAAIFDDYSSDGLVAALRAARQWSRGCRVPLVATCASLARVMCDRSGREPSTGGAASSLLMPRLRQHVEDVAATGDRRLRDVRPSKRPLARLLLAYADMARLDYPVNPPGLIHAYPFSHRPLVEFVLAIPGSVLTAPGDTRTLMRRAFAGLVPARVLERQSKGYYPPAALRGLRPVAASMLPVDRLEVVRRGWIEPMALDAALRALANGGAAGTDLRRVLRFEQWLASRQRRGPAVTPTGEEVKTNGVLNA